MNFADNEAWCDSKYPWGQAVDQAAGDKLLDQATRCKKSGIFSPWTVAGRLERGLVDDAALKNLVKTIATIGKAPKPPPAAPPPSGFTLPAMRANVMTYGVLAVAGVLGAMLVLGKKKGRGSRRRRR